MDTAIATKTSVRDMYRREHYAGVSSPASHDGRDVARWLLVLSLHRDGRADAVRRAGEILPSLLVSFDLAAGPFHTVYLPPGAMVRQNLMTIRERTSLCLAIWEAYTGPLDWPQDIISVCFAMPPTDVEAACNFVGAELRAGISQDCRQGIADVRAEVRRWIAATRP